MPRCKNDHGRYYKGTEPSPKGKGFCAHACKVNQRKKGTDGKMWAVVSYSGRKRWVRSDVLRKKKICAKKRTKKHVTQRKKKHTTKRTLRGGESYMLVKVVLPGLINNEYVNDNIKMLFQEYIQNQHDDEKVMDIIESTIKVLSSLPQSKNPKSELARKLNMFKTMRSMIQRNFSTGSSPTSVNIRTLTGKKTMIEVQKTDPVYGSIQPITDELDFARGSELYYGKECVWKRQSSDANKTWLDIEKDIGQRLEAVNYFVWI